MKITNTRLREIIREEASKLNEKSSDGYFKEVDYITRGNFIQFIEKELGFKIGGTRRKIEHTRHFGARSSTYTFEYDIPGGPESVLSIPKLKSFFDKETRKTSEIGEMLFILTVTDTGRGIVYFSYGIEARFSTPGNQGSNQYRIGKAEGDRRGFEITDTKLK